MATRIGGLCLPSVGAGDSRKVADRRQKVYEGYLRLGKSRQIQTLHVAETILDTNDCLLILTVSSSFKHKKWLMSLWYCFLTQILESSSLLFL